MCFKGWPWTCKDTQYWSDIVDTYGRCAITEPNDRLFAIAGIANSLQPMFQDKYLAGLWKKDIPYNLAWSLANVEEVRASQQYRGMSSGHYSTERFVNHLAQLHLGPGQVSTTLVHWSPTRSS